MNEQFEIRGLFYENQGHLCRKYLNIKKKSITDKPDLMVVMMNPGSSEPLDKNNRNTLESKAKPDKTQEQIMKIMNACNFNYARIINLSDLREPKSEKFYKKLGNLKDVPHSIFSDDRLQDFETLFIKEVPVIFAWGVNKKLEILAKMAMKRIVDNVYGILKEGTSSAYYHPLPRTTNDQENWCKNIILCLKNGGM